MGEDFAEALAQFENRQNPVAWKTWKAGRIKKLQEKYIEARTLFLACFSMFQHDGFAAGVKVVTLGCLQILLPLGY